jgi:hypothetical protein
MDYILLNGRFLWKQQSHSGRLISGESLYQLINLLWSSQGSCYIQWSEEIPFFNYVEYEESKIEDVEGWPTQCSD